MTTPLIEAVDLQKYFHTPKGELHAVDRINFTVMPGETLGVIGESGCGKSTLGRVVLHLLPATGGKIFFDGRDITTLSRRESIRLRSEMQIIFQDPYSSLDPRMTVEDLIKEPLILSGRKLSRQQINEKVRELMEKVGLARRIARSYPHELDGGRRQRIGVARALSVDPRFIVCDEPVSALDVSVQAQILNLLMDLQAEMKLTYLFITHDLSVARHISDNIMVMYLGQCIEISPVQDLFENPLHPYTKALLQAIPKPESKARHEKLKIIRGEVSNPIEPKPGCRFAPRCEFCNDKCMQKDFELKEHREGHFVACQLFEGKSV